MALAVTRTEHSAAALRREARRTKDSDQARRLLALALVMEGASRTTAARTAGMDRQTLRDWVIRYNEEGVDGLRDRPHLLGVRVNISCALRRRGGQRDATSWTDILRLAGRWLPNGSGGSRLGGAVMGRNARRRSLRSRSGRSRRL